MSNLCLKLSNSGDTLKLRIPSLIRNKISGQNKYLGKVTSPKMSENQMGYRGSKSGILPVKEQRIDGSWFLNKNLRCILMGGESCYQIKILSKQLNKNKKTKKKFFYFS
uniref:LAGLIDADG endonuclease n=1 Tax=Agaricus bitorquis TaxID=5343 RepID=UPI0027988B9D|nr:LAGLIDADG endonuclease [Agaricus bitorquis]WFG54038.1 LAGLIDADG endonuclease [Agaricus bitorquis]